MISLDCQNKIAGYLINRPFFLTISLDLTKSSEVRKAGDRPKVIDEQGHRYKCNYKNFSKINSLFYLVTR